MKYDIVIAGCGIAGAVAGLTALQKGLTVCIVEKMNKEYIGKKVCGELTTQKTVSWLKTKMNISIDNYPLKGLQMCASSGYKANVPEPLCTIDRWHTGQGLLNALLDRGADIRQGTVKKPINTSFVKGVKTKDFLVYGAVTIDCSGVASVLRRTFVGDRQLLGVAYKEIVMLKEPFTTLYAVLSFDKRIIPSGYVWCFPKNAYEVNVGAGGLGRGRGFFKKNLEKALQSFGLSIKKREQPGLGVVPLGGPLPCMVYPGLLLCGDAANQVNPLTGEGIAPAVIAGYLAGLTAADAVHNEDATVSHLWKYTYDFAQTYGVEHAPLVVARDYLVSLSDDQLTYFLENLITGKELAELIKGRTPHPIKKVKTVLQNYKKLPLLYHMYSVMNRMNRIRNLYKEYPVTPEGFSLWHKTLCTQLKN
jgi:flavin-dependent dehydrogenase